MFPYINNTRCFSSSLSTWTVHVHWLPRMLVPTDFNYTQLYKDMSLMHVSSKYLWAALTNWHVRLVTTDSVSWACHFMSVSSITRHVTVPCLTARRLPSSSAASLGPSSSSPASSPASVAASKVRHHPQEWSTRRLPRQQETWQLSAQVDYSTYLLTFVTVGTTWLIVHTT